MREIAAVGINRLLKNSALYLPAVTVFSITLSRVALLPWWINTFHQGKFFDGLWIWIAMLFTDVVDGWLARRWQVVSRLGAITDAVSDKMVTVVALSLLEAPWFLSVYIIKEVLQGGFLVFAYRTQRLLNPEALWIGKLAMLMTSLYIVLLQNDLAGMFSIPYSVIGIIRSLLAFIWAASLHAYALLWLHDVNKKRI